MPVVIRPGDTLVVAYSDSLDLEEIDRITQEVRRHAPEIGVLVLQGVSDLAVFPADRPVSIEGELVADEELIDRAVEKMGDGLLSALQRHYSHAG